MFRSVVIVLPVSFSLQYIIFFSRTIYPAIDVAVGGGAPRLATLVDLQGNSRTAIVLHQSPQGLYFYNLRCGKVIPASVFDRDALTARCAIVLAQLGAIARPSGQSVRLQRFQSTPQHTR